MQSKSWFSPGQLVAVMLAGWNNRNQQAVIAYQKEVPDCVAVDAAELARSAVESAEASALQRGVQLVLRTADESCVAHGDPAVLSRVIDNLLANALEHSRSESKVTVAVTPREEGVEIAVADQGPGIPVDQREKVFAKYARLELRKAGVSANRGLGLTFCRMAIDAHDGLICIDDSPEGGALFRVILPASELDDRKNALRDSMATTAVWVSSENDLKSRKTVKSVLRQRVERPDESRFRLYLWLRFDAEVDGEPVDNEKTQLLDSDTSI